MRGTPVAFPPRPEDKRTRLCSVWHRPSLTARRTVKLLHNPKFSDPVYWADSSSLGIPTDKSGIGKSIYFLVIYGHSLTMMGHKSHETLREAVRAVHCSELTARTGCAACAEIWRGWNCQPTRIANPISANPTAGNLERSQGKRCLSGFGREAGRN